LVWEPKANFKAVREATLAADIRTDLKPKLRPTCFLNDSTQINSRHRKATSLLTVNSSAPRIHSDIKTIVLRDDLIVWIPRLCAGISILAWGGYCVQWLLDLRRGRQGK
jgi:hypothetical protein